MRYPTYLMLVLFAGAAGCAHRPPPAPEKPQLAYGCPVGTKPVHSMGDLIADKVQSAGEVKDISVPELQCSMQGDVLRIDFTLANSAAYVRRIAYRFDWIDRDGRKAWDDESWKPVYLYEHSRQTVMSTAPAPTAVDFRLVVLDQDKKR